MSSHMAKIPISVFFLLLVSHLCTAEDCGQQAGGKTCAPSVCCSKWGYCGTTDALYSQFTILHMLEQELCLLMQKLYMYKNLYMHGDGCQSQCRGGSGNPPFNPSPIPTPSGCGSIESIISSSLFDQLLKHRSDSRCSGSFYTYNAFITAAKSFPAFGNTGSEEQKKREIAAFLAQTSKETAGGWASAPDGPYAWGYCFVEEQNKFQYCQETQEWKCASGKKYHGRGPIQLAWNYNYGQAGKALGFDGINNPEIVANDPVVAFKTAIWFWMTPQNPIPSSHDVILGIWKPSSADTAAGRVSSSYGTITNIINGGLECGKGPNDSVKDRIGFYERYCQVFGISPGSNLDCYNQKPW